MCLAIPGTITKIQNGEATIDYDGVSKQADLSLNEKAVIGDIVLVHAGFVIQILDKKAGKKLQKLVKATLEAL
jgi:hydrogenase expression/formation protein HypC